MSALNLPELQTKMRAAAEAYVEGIMKKWPEGTRVKVWLNTKQQVPSPGAVLHAYSDGRVAIRLSSVNRRGHNTIKRVHWTRIQS